MVVGFNVLMCFMMRCNLELYLVMFFLNFFCFVGVKFGFLKFFFGILGSVLRVFLVLKLNLKRRFFVIFWRLVDCFGILSEMVIDLVVFM